jgi:hypothetical protein
VPVALLVRSRMRAHGHTYTQPRFLQIFPLSVVITSAGRVDPLRKGSGGGFLTWMTARDLRRGRQREFQMMPRMIRTNTCTHDTCCSSEFSTKLWAGLTSEMALRECEIYSYVQDMDDDALSVGKMSAPPHLTLAKAKCAEGPEREWEGEGGG